MTEPNYNALTSLSGILGNVKVVVNLAITFGDNGHLSPWSLQASGIGTLKGMVSVPSVTVTLLVRFLMASSVVTEKMTEAAFGLKLCNMIQRSHEVTHYKRQ